MIQNKIDSLMDKVMDSTRPNVDIENKQSTQTSNWNLNANDFDGPITFDSNEILHDVFGNGDGFSNTMAEDLGFVHSTDDIVSTSKKCKTVHASKSRISSGGCSHPSIPTKSKERYQESWNSLCKYFNLDLIADSYKPTIDDIMMYLDDQASLGKRPSTLISLFSKLNGCYRSRFGTKLQIEKSSIARRINSLPSLGVVYRKHCAKIFTEREIVQFLNINFEGSHWILRKAFVAVSYTGGLKTMEARSLTYGDVKVNTNGFEISYSPTAQNEKMLRKRFQVERDSENPGSCPASHLNAYLVLLRESLGQRLSNSTRMWLTCLKNGKLSQTPISKTLLYQISKDVAREIGLDQNDYAGSSFRRSCTNNFVVSGVQPP